ncbi:hypothetical protein IMSHALPRED_007418 [Imshaugia aleurites]|uniref:Uncharacterized protein n=1 Tax=Imshaugia aleurites TaxID=172621 RepID=A0A8H3FSF3_9LECA|nr:hypothetical protein IMSHALPRED_007418 [Imshaugia aleurites]
MTSADGAPAPLRGFDGWLDDLYDDNGLFNEDLGDALDSFMAADVISGERKLSDFDILNTLHEPQITDGRTA